MEPLAEEAMLGKLLPFHRRIVEELIEEDGLCILSAGMGWQKVVRILRGWTDRQTVYRFWLLEAPYFSVVSLVRRWPFFYACKWRDLGAQKRLALCSYWVPQIGNVI